MLLRTDLILPLLDDAFHELRHLFVAMRAKLVDCNTKLGFAEQLFCGLDFFFKDRKQGDDTLGGAVRLFKIVHHRLDLRYVQ